MNTKKNLLIFTFLLITGIALTSFVNRQAATKTEYLSIYLREGDFTEVHISIDGKDFQKLNLVSEYRSLKGFNPMINLIHQYEKDGWTLMGVPQYLPYGNPGGYLMGTMVMMKREKSE